MGKLLVIDGTDGSGKQTQLELLKNRLTKEGVDYRTVSFPVYDSPSSALVKMYLSGEFGENPDDISPYIASTFYAVDRYATFQKGLKAYYEAGGIILADRYTTANMLHQAGKIHDLQEREKFLEWVTDLEYHIYGIPEPTKVFFLNMPPDKAMELMQKRDNKFTHNAVKDIHEKNKHHIANAYQVACSLVSKYHWCEIQCMKDNVLRTREDIHEEIYQIVTKEICKK